MYNLLVEPHNNQKGNMMDAEFIALFALFVLLLLSIFFSACETAYSALNRIRLKTMADKGMIGAQLALKLHEDFNRLLSTLLVGNNVANLSAAAICSVLFVRRFGDIGATISTIVLTTIVIVFADVTPKALAKESPEKVARLTAPFLNLFVMLFTPINVFFVKWRILLGYVFKTNIEDKQMTEEELISIVEEAEQDGLIDKDDKTLVRNALDFYDKQTKDILTPRMDIEGIAINTPLEEIAEKFLETGFSRLPVYEESIDHIVGIIHMRDFFRRMTGQNEQPMSLWEITSPSIFVAPQTNVSELFKLLQTAKGHMAIVSDEYGGTDGIVTMEDILEELVGEIWDESDEVVEKFVTLEDGTVRVICTASMDDLFIYINMQDKEPESDSATVGGWIVDSLEKIPEEGDSFEYSNLRVTVSKTEHRRALECVVQVFEEAGEE